MKRKHIPFCLFLFTLYSCGDSFWSYTPASQCDPKSSLTGPDQQKWSELFSKNARMKACMKVSVTVKSDPSKIIYTHLSPTIMGVNGELYDLNTGQSVSDFTFSLPDLQIQESKQGDYHVLFRLYVLNEESLQDQTKQTSQEQEKHLSLCEHMRSSQSKCSSPDCWFYIKLSPQIPPHLKYQRETLPSSCQVAKD